MQGDEPFIHESQIRSVCDCFNDSSTQIATLGKPFGRTPDDIKAIENPNSPKIAVSKEGFALYFSRSVIPFCRGIERNLWPESFPYLKHIGLYAYRREVLREVTQLPQGELEKAESLEQLRWLENGYKIKVGLTDIGQIEGHTNAPDNAKTTKYEHLLPLLASLEESDEVDGVLILLNTVGGDVEAGLAIAELIAIIGYSPLTSWRMLGWMRRW